MSDQWFTDERRKNNILNNLNRDQEIYRIFSKDRFLNVLSDKKLTLVKPNLWDDPFENIIFNSSVEAKNEQKISIRSIGNSYHGQCWTLNEESDAMWRIYSHEKDGIKVKTSVGKLFDAFFDTEESPELRCYFGKVQYKNEQEIVKMLQDKNLMHNMIFDHAGYEAAKSLLFKRTEFSHEMEARLIHVTFDENSRNKDIYEFKIDPNIVFDSITLDPRISDKDYNQLYNELVKLGLTIPIYKSNLYSIPNQIIKLDIDI